MSCIYVHVCSSDVHVTVFETIECHGTGNWVCLEISTVQINIFSYAS